MINQDLEQRSHAYWRAMAQPQRLTTAEIQQAELKDAAKQERKFKEWADALPDHLEPSAADFERTARLNNARRRGLLGNVGM